MASVKDFFQNLRISKENLQFSRLKLFMTSSWRRGATDQNYFGLFRFFRWQLLIVPSFIIFLQRIQKLLMGGGGGAVSAPPGWQCTETPRWDRIQLHVAICRPDSFVLMLRYFANLKAIRYESTILNRIVADKSHSVIVA